MGYVWYRQLTALGTPCAMVAPTLVQLNFVGSALRQRQEVVREEVKEIAWKQQHRFLARYRNLTARVKNKGQVITAIGRELVGFHLGHRKTAVGFSFVYKR